MDSGSGSTNQACAACKFQRRRCSSDCPLARYFPADQNQRFMNCKRLFGVSNIMRLLREAPPAEKDDTMKSFMNEADARARDPVHGCLGIITRLKQQVVKLTEELHFAREHLHLMEQQHAAAATSLSMYQHQYLTQSLGVPATDSRHSPAHVFLSTSSMVAPASIYNHYDHHPINNPHMCMDHVAIMEYDHTRPSALIDSDEYNGIPGRQPYDQPRLNEDMPLNAVPEHELKSAAALFGLT